MFDKSVPLPLAKAIFRFANAIASAEGFFTKNSRPSRNHNPGDLTLDLAGNTAVAVGKDGSFMVYETDIEGWIDLCEQVHLMFTGQSKYYKPSMTIHEVAMRYTATAQEEWARIVAGRLGVPTSTRLQDLVPKGAPNGN